jgi:hypothetical protein
MKPIERGKRILLRNRRESAFSTCDAEKNWKMRWCKSNWNCDIHGDTMYTSRPIKRVSLIFLLDSKRREQTR